MVADGGAPVAQQLLTGSDKVLKVESKEGGEMLQVTLNDQIEDGSFIADLLVRNNLRLKMLREEQINLEDVFMAITKGITN